MPFYITRIFSCTVKQGALLQYTTKNTVQISLQNTLLLYVTKYIMFMWHSFMLCNYEDDGISHTSPSLLTYHQNKSGWSLDWLEWTKTHFYIPPKSSGIITLLDQLFMQNNLTASPSVLPGNTQYKQKRHVMNSKVLWDNISYLLQQNYLFLNAPNTTLNICLLHSTVISYGTMLPFGRIYNYQHSLGPEKFICINVDKNYYIWVSYSFYKSVIITHYIIQINSSHLWPLSV